MIGGLCTALALLAFAALLGVTALSLLAWAPLALRRDRRFLASSRPATGVVTRIEDDVEGEGWRVHFEFAHEDGRTETYERFVGGPRAGYAVGQQVPLRYLPEPAPEDERRAATRRWPLLGEVSFTPAAPEPVRLGARDRWAYGRTALAVVGGLISGCSAAAVLAGAVAAGVWALAR